MATDQTTEKKIVPDEFYVMWADNIAGSGMNNKRARKEALIAWNKDCLEPNRLTVADVGNHLPLSFNEEPTKKEGQPDQANKAAENQMDGSPGDSDSGQGDGGTVDDPDPDYFKGQSKKEIAVFVLEKTGITINPKSFNRDDLIKEAFKTLQGV